MGGGQLHVPQDGRDLRHHERYSASGACVSFRIPLVMFLQCLAACVVYCHGMSSWHRPLYWCPAIRLAPLANTVRIFKSMSLVQYHAYRDWRCCGVHDQMAYDKKNKPSEQK